MNLSNFREELNAYVAQLQCSGKDLANATGLSPAVISRYRTGERMPAQNSEQMQKLAEGLASLAAQQELAAAAGFAQDDIYATLNAALDVEPDMAEMVDKLNALISLLQINASELARSMNYDTSYLSRIRNGKRRPANQAAFVEGVCRFVVRKYSAFETKQSVAHLLDCDIAALATAQAYLTTLTTWLSSGTLTKKDSLDTFLKTLNEFNLDEYIRSIHFDELKVPSLPFTLPTSKNYYGIEEMKTGELDFFKATVLSKSTEHVLMCSDMPMEDMAQDLAFRKKWMFGLALMLKKGLHLNVVHNLNRPFEEMMLGLESWIPLYMTGHISPYYLRGPQSTVFCHMNYCSGAAALHGECIVGSHEKGKYYLTKNKEDVAYYRTKAECILEKATSLMDIYRKDSQNAYRAFLASDATTPGARHNVLSAPPLYTLPAPLLAGMLERNHVADHDRKRIEDCVAESRSSAESILANNTIFDEVPLITEEEFEKHPMVLVLADIFYEADIRYTYADYLEHLQATLDYAAAHPAYTAVTNEIPGFRNIQITIHEGEWVKVSKSKFPAIHFVIRHPQLREALENMTIPVVE